MPYAMGLDHAQRLPAEDARSSNRPLPGGEAAKADAVRAGPVRRDHGESLFQHGIRYHSGRLSKVGHVPVARSRSRQSRHTDPTGLVQRTHQVSTRRCPNQPLASPISSPAAAVAKYAIASPFDRRATGCRQSGSRWLTYGENDDGGFPARAT